MAVLALSCRCGKVQGELKEATPKTISHAMCYCKDCQAFAKAIGQEAILDPHGGSEVLQATPSQVHFHQGAEQLRCLRLTPKGTHRWYTECCKTPVANTASANLPFVGLLHCMFADPEGRDQAVGPISKYIQAQDAINPPLPHPEAVEGFPRLMLLSMATRMLLARLSGKHQPNPFYGADKRPVSKPEVVNS